MNWVFENDEEGLAGPPMDQWVIRDEDTDNRDIVAVVPKTGDEVHDNAVTYPHACLLTAAPELLKELEGLLATAEAVDVGNKQNPAFRGCGFSPDLFRRCHSAIAKAKGETS